jgi:Cu(I)/Ag(I) efflux system membrane fusion protein
MLMLIACTKPAVEQVQTGSLSLQVSVDPDPPVVGDNRLLVEVRDAAGQPVDGAKLDFLYDMPAMGAMPEMKGGGTVKTLGDGRYEIAYPLAMNGDWALTLHVQAGSASNDLRLRVAPGTRGVTVDREAAAGGHVLAIPPGRQQLIGVTFGTVEPRPLSLHVRAPGRVTVDETQVSDVTLKYDAYVEKLSVSQTGQAVKRGQPLLTLYSAELLAAEQDYLIARRSASSGAPGTHELLAAAERRLSLWNVTPEQRAALEKHGQAEPRITVLSPASGVVLEKNVVEGTRVMAGSTLFRIGNLGQVWVDTDLYEADAKWIALGQPAEMALPWGGEPQRGRVSFIYPTIDERTRTLRARLAFANAGLSLKPGMYVDVTLEVPLGNRLSVPDSALLISGTHRYAFIERGPGKLEPVEVQIGARAGDFDEVRAGLSAGDRVATQATFLLSSEARLRDALPRWGAP